MDNKNNLAIIIAGIGLVTTAAAGIIGYNSGKGTGMEAMYMDMMKMDSKATVSSQAKPPMMMDHSEMTMDQMTEGLQGLTGDAFDKAFIEMMIVHHQGAVDMAAMIPANAKHEELKKLGREIITAQTKEIAMMQQWLKDWGYEGAAQKMDNDGMMMDHMMMPGMQH